MVEISHTDDGIEYDFSDNTMVVDFEIAIDGYAASPTAEERDALEQEIASRLSADDVTINHIDVQSNQPLKRVKPEYETYVSGTAVC
jgi:hypothetical protein